MLVRATDNSDSRKSFLTIVSKMCNECSRVVYLFLFFMRKVASDMRSSRGDDGLDAERMMETYKCLSNELDISVESMLIKDL